jgi:GDP-4-dehydro-6-deoxy-D-mannose reductase
VNAGMVDSIELSRLDSARDYVSVDDIASAFGAIIEGNPTHAVYNIGSGVSTTNGELLDMLVNSYPIKKNIHIKQTSDIVEPLVAIQADIGRLANDFGWKPQTTLNDTVREIVYEQSR